MAERPDPVKSAITHLEIALGYLAPGEPHSIENAQDAIRDVLDQLTGFCSPHMRLVANNPEEKK